MPVLLKNQRATERAVKELQILGIPVTREYVATAVKGQQLKARFLKNTPALAKLKEAVEGRYETNNRTLIGLDGRPLRCRSKHSALNTLLQSAGALLCKRWLVEMHQRFAAEGLVNGRDYMQSAWVHDEVQVQVRTEEIGHAVGRIAKEAIKAAGEYFKFRCPLDGEYGLGPTWADTH